MVVAFIDAHKDAFGVEPICRVLRQHDVAKIAPSTYYAFKSRQPSLRSVRDAELLIEIRRVHADRKLGRGLYGAVKVLLTATPRRVDDSRGLRVTYCLGRATACELRLVAIRKSVL